MNQNATDYRKTGLTIPFVDTVYSPGSDAGQAACSEKCQFMFQKCEWLAVQRSGMFFKLFWAVDVMNLAPGVANIKFFPSEIQLSAERKVKAETKQEAMDTT